MVSLENTLCILCTSKISQLSRDSYFSAITISPGKESVYAGLCEIPKCPCTDYFIFPLSMGSICHSKSTFCFVTTEKELLSSSVKNLEILINILWGSVNGQPTMHNKYIIGCGVEIWGWESQLQFSKILLRNKGISMGICLTYCIIWST